jgi:hypothetical protein
MLKLFVNNFGIVETGECATIFRSHFFMLFYHILSFVYFSYFQSGQF